eukprot:jgi/Psemu1/41169/gm1.41169_g
MLFVISSISTNNGNSFNRIVTSKARRIPSKLPRHRQINNNYNGNEFAVASPLRHFNDPSYLIDDVLLFIVDVRRYQSFRDDMFIHQSNTSDSDLKLLFPSFDLKLARILHTTLDVPREACNHLCEALILANSTTWDWFITDIVGYGYVADLEYHVQNGYRSISMDDQRTLTTFVDLTNLINSLAGRNWYDHHQYTRDVFLAFCDTRDRSPGMAAILEITRTTAVSTFKCKRVPIQTMEETHMGVSK